ncbi:MAG: diguanylate cyclase [Solirubrobacterales bacterium]
MGPDNTSRTGGEPPAGAGATHPQRRTSDKHLAEQARRFEEVLKRGDPEAAQAVAEEGLTSGLGVEQVYSDVIAPAMRRIGQLWQHAEVSVASEHLATAMSQGVMARLFPQLLVGEQRSREVVMLAATQGEQHVLGLKMIADTLEGAGYGVRYLGADVPLKALLEACRRHAPAVLGLSASMGLNVPTMIWEIREVARLDPAPAVMVGGRAVGLAVEEGLDAPIVEHCEEAAEVVRELIDGRKRSPAVSASLTARVPAGPSTSEIAVPGEASMAAMFAASSTAVTDAVREEARQAFDRSYRDPLTKLWNREAYDDRIAKLSSEGTPKGAALMLDVDRFKAINDTHGHDTGDETLIGVGEAILGCIRPTDFGARFGGDEFVALLPGMSSREATVVAERIRDTVERDLSDPPVTVSIGVADLSDDPRLTGLSIDGALYQAKRAGRNRVAGAGT